MAEKASSAQVAADMQPASYRSAVQIIRHAIQKKKEKIAEINGAIGEQWAKVEGHKVNKKAGRIFAMLDKLEHEERVEIMRSLNGLIDAAGWDEFASDLADLAENNVVPLRVGGSAPEAEEGGDEDQEPEPADEEEMQAVEQALDEPAKPRRRGRKAAEPEAATAAKTVAEKAEERRETLRRMRDAGAAEPFTGDNSDLAGE